MTTHAEPTETDRTAAKAALQLGVLRLYDQGIGYVAPELCDLTGRELEHGLKVARHTLDNWAKVSTAAYRIVTARHYDRAA